MALSSAYAPVISVQVGDENPETGAVQVTSDKLGLEAFEGLSPSTLPLSGAASIALARKASMVYTTTELRNANILGNQVYFLTEVDREGFWYYDLADTTSQDNTGTVVVAFNGKRYKRHHFGTILSAWFEQNDSGFQAFLDASENKTGIINKSIELTTTITLRSGNIEQLNGVVVTTGANGTGFSANGIKLKLRTTEWKAKNSLTSTLLNIQGSSEVEFHDCKITDWVKTCLNIVNSRVYIQKLELIGVGMTYNPDGKAFVTNNMQNSFINSLYIYSYGERALDCTGGQNVSFSDVQITDQNGTKPIYITNTNNYKFDKGLVGHSSLVNSATLSNNRSLKFNNFLFTSHIDIDNPNINTLFTGCNFLKTYRDPQYDEFNFTDVIFANVFYHTMNQDGGSDPNPSNDAVTSDQGFSL